ncbi:uncharacterized protein LOC124938093 isoform X2 [Impatiens glandulifera]|uniref:uncharacterized protein LOC124938093 isoform X2 n=1 Tax=Impatiens glandulifera TaxID=253017 RepID=UPI001FB08A78|nr:uncharacterized protein LOC124938093 isoform X2 [Impatiens glandulifera]
MPPGGDATTDDQCNTETDEGTIAMHKKRSRRVSFAELTSVHVFVRDAENETPTDPEPPSPDAKLVQSSNGLGLRRQDSTDGEYSKESTLNDDDDDDGEDECSGRRLFLRPMESASPGGSTMGSATSDDDDDFFGPVSASFIRPGRFSDSAASDDNHDRTMDSTAFSLHFRSLVRSDLGEMTAPTTFQMSLDERTPIKNSLSTTLGDSLTPTIVKSKVSDSSACIDKFSSHADSSGMSLVGEDAQKYDYGKLSPGLDALLAEGRNVLQADVVPDNTIVKSPINNISMPLMSDVTQLVRSHETVAVSKVMLEDENNGFLPSALSEPADGFSSDIGKVPGSNNIIDQRNWPPEYSRRGTPHMNTDGTEVPRKSPVICNEVFDIISNDATEVVLHEHLSSEARFTPLSARRKMNFASCSPSKTHVNTPILGNSSSLARYEVKEHCGSISSVQRSMSRLKMLESSPFSASVKVKRASALTSSYLCKTPPPTVVLEEVKSITCMDYAVAGSSHIKPYADPYTPQKHNDVFKMNQNPVSLEECIDSQSNSLTVDDGDNAKTRLGHDVEFSKKIEHVSLSAIPANDLDTLSARGQYKSPSARKSNISVVESVCEKDVAHYNTQDVPETLGNDMTHWVEIESHSTQCFASDTSLHVQMNHTSEGEMRYERETSSCGVDSPLSYMTYNEPQQQGLNRSPLKKISKMTNNESVPSLGLLPANHGQDANLFENSVERKRRRDDIISSKNDSLDELVQIQSSSKLRKVAGNSETLVERPEENTSEMFTGQERTKLEHWDDVFSKFVADKKQLVSPLHDKASLQNVDQLLDLLVQQQRLKQYEFLRMEILPKKLHNLDNHQQKRVAEARMLLNRIAHQHTELQLMSMKREMLLKKVQLVNGYSREVQMLKSSYQSSSSVPCTRGPPIDKCNDHSANSENNHEVSSDKVNAMKQILEASSSKIFNLTKFFHTAFKIKGEPTSIETTALVNDLLKRRVRCRFLSQNLKLWEVADIESRTPHHNAVLNYHNIIAQRFTIDFGSVTNIVLSNQLNEKTILKNFPNMNAVVAFAFVLNTHASQKNVGHRSLSQEIQITGSVLGNLLDVIEEVQQTRIKIPNLISSRFCSPSAEELELHICFLNFRIGRKVAFALNLSSLSWGIYPTEAIPFELEDGSLPKLAAGEVTKIRAAIESLKAGYSRISRLCSCISELVENWSG